MSDKAKVKVTIPQMLSSTRRSGAVACNICKRILPLTFFPDKSREIIPYNNNDDSIIEDLVCLTCGKLPSILPVPEDSVQLESGAVEDKEGSGKLAAKPHQCRYCDRTLCSPHSRVLHERLHTGEKPFECKVCGKRFHNPQYYRIHSTIHTGEKPYQCGICNKCFRLSNSLASHRKTHNSGEKPYAYRCEDCGRKFQKSISLKSHSCTQTHVVQAD